MFESQVATSIIPTLRRYRLAFLHAGSLFQPDQLVDAIMSVCQQRGIRTWLGTEANLEVPESIDPNQLFVVSGLERLSGSGVNARCQELGRLRTSVTEVLESNGQVLLLSQTPAYHLMGCPGSSVVLDAKSLFLDRIAPERVRELYPDSGLNDSLIGSGLPGLVSRTPSSMEAESVNQVLFSALTRAVVEMGQTGVAWLEQETCKNNRWVLASADLDQALIDAVRGAGLASSSDQWSTLRLFDGFARPLARSVVLSACRKEVRPEDGLARAFSSLWEIERTMRYFVENRLNLAGSTIASTLGPDPSRRSITRAQADGYGAVDSIDSLPNALDWLTMDELLDLLEKVGTPSRAKFRLQFWRRLVAELGPVRNKLAHMRLLTEADIRLTEAWRSRIRQVDLGRFV